ncbi:glycine zipper family protein [Mesobacterium sp. TK19101]|uniref:Glycine zipper family protein n=1 Tax=Mesobacterium hydrothermale TaxID=3111907 RepID=A0ABU6HL41_9RHOB|nr:glycine zipper family protein [Mesobacterium sp. TK19101]MEC3863164.1 glycine zipper family protein [Mesobacterium sp. TK19101]
MKPQFFGLLGTVSLLAACADTGANYTPILDGAPTAAYQADLAECRALARDQRQFDQETAGAAVLGAGAGALLGAADDDGTALGGAVAGALAGGVAGIANSAERRQAIVIECLRGRGHHVVG